MLVANKWCAWGLVVCALGTYIAPATAKPEFAQSEGKQNNKIAPINKLVEGLHERLRKQPDDVKGWVLLAKSYNHIGDWHEAAKAAAKARKLGYEGEILPDEKTIVPKAKGHNSYHGYKGTSAGTYVESFFNQQDDAEGSASSSKDKTGQ